MARFRLLEPHLTDGRELRSVAAGSGVSFRTLQRWVTRYRHSGLAALVRRPRKDRGDRRVLSSRMKAAIEGLALEKPPLPISSVHRQICQFAKQVQEDPPSYATVLSVARALPNDGQSIHQNRLLQLAREGAATTPQHLARFDDPRRHGTLIAVLLEASSTLTDKILDLHDRFVGSIFNKARRRRDEAFQFSGKATNEKVRLYARIGQALLAAKEQRTDPFAAIERIVSWGDFARTVSEAEELAQPEAFDFLGLISNGFPQMRRYTPRLLELFDFRAAPAARPLLEVVEILRAMNRDKMFRPNKPLEGPDVASGEIVKEVQEQYGITHPDRP